jgi:hypothetical protein
LQPTITNSHPVRAVWMRGFSMKRSLRASFIESFPETAMNISSWWFPIILIVFHGQKPRRTRLRKQMLT